MSSKVNDDADLAAAADGDAKGSKRSRIGREIIETQVFDVAAKLFAEKGYGGTTLQHIASALGVSRTALYYYVSSKEELLSTIVHELTDAGFALVSAEADAQGSASDRLRAIVDSMTRLVASSPARFRLLLQSEAGLPAELLEAHRDTRRRVLRRLMDVIEEGQRNGEFRVVDARITALAIIGMWNWTAFWARSNSDIDQIAETFGDLVVRGLAAGSREVRGAARTPQQVLNAVQEDLATLAVMLPDDPA
ncbi:TetR/AcrR family transcriptional regulator [Nocardia cerradoensis]|uniref:HTH-type transcriptional repressor KstR2 n=1 Tax=Nocardia cerradoensis TaxID=85688 RepID=A0A231GTP2_9NOCA|nr:TetR/AcrR family transcriptional regulator [Nocardia cerradoensis]NKY41861.1 TetR/AcrR family transcriptional regulator [Nocardia cerradoensis]OXR39994.1 HTH-type transcriptional repressor KstR2 [Nocardia cerradoensis]